MGHHDLAPLSSRRERDGLALGPPPVGPRTPSGTAADAPTMPHVMQRTYRGGKGKGKGKGKG